jgi:hypothetical protein
MGFHSKNLVLLQQIQAFFGIKNIFIGKYYSIYSVKSIKDLINIIIPHFLFKDKYPLITQKELIFYFLNKLLKL